MSNQIKFDIFQVETTFYDESDFDSFEDLLNNPPINQFTLARNGNQFDLYKQIQKRGNYYTGVFCLVQMNELPPKTKLGDTPATLGLDPDEGLGHYTPFIFDPEYNIIIIEAKYGGVTSNAIAEYYRRKYNLKDISFNLVIDPATIERLTRITDIRSLEVTIAKAENGGIFDSRNQSIRQITNIADGTNTNVLRIEMSAGLQRNTFLNSNKIKSIIRALVGYRETNEVIKAEIKGREGDEDRQHIIDFVKNRVRLLINLPRTRNITDRYISDCINKAIAEYNLVRPNLQTFKVKSKR
jgi:hypothetical protein